MKHPFIYHLPSPRSAKWALVTLTIYGLSVLIMLSLAIIVWVTLR